MKKLFRNNKKSYILLFIIISITMMTFCKEQKGGKTVTVQKTDPGINGIIIMMLGKVEVQQANGIFKSMKIKDEIKQTDFLQTGRNSFVTIQFQDRGMIRVQAKTKIRLNRLFSNNNSDIYLEQGQILTKINKLKKGENFGIRTHTAVASVRGTEFSTSYYNNKSVIAVLKGKVAVKPPVKKDTPIEKIFEKSADEQIIESGKVVTAKLIIEEQATKEPDGTEKAPDGIKEVSVKKKVSFKIAVISQKDKLVIQKISIVKIIPEPEKKTEKELKTIQKTLQKIEKKIDKKIKVEVVKEKKIIKQKKIVALIKKKPKTLKEIKEVFERIDEITLFNGRVLKGAIISRGNNYRILTLGGVKRISGNQIKGVKVIR